MAIKLIKMKYEYIGLSTDPKPKAFIGSEFLEEDTKKRFICNGELSWIFLRRESAPEITPISSGPILATESYISDAISVSSLQGIFSLLWTVTGDGTMKAEVLVSNDGVHFFDLDPDICDGQTKLSGDGGTNMDSFDVTPCEFIKIKFTEVGGADDIEVEALLKMI